jgi:non-canonical (house-cleaning) NTP pyrophosphatase
MTKLIMLAAGMKKQSGKERALMTALTRFEHPQLRAELFNVTSGVDEQPIGDVMDLGAENRAINAVRAANQERKLPTCHRGLELSELPEFSYGIGAESGVQLRRGFIIDSTTVIIVHRMPDDSFKTIALHTSEGVPMPTKHFNVAVERGLREHTGGSVYAENVPGLDKANWHPHATRGFIDRFDLMANAFSGALCQVVWPCGAAFKSSTR